MIPGGAPGRVIGHTESGFDEISHELLFRPSPRGR